MTSYSKASIARLIDNVETVFLSCCKTVLIIETGSTKESLSQDIVEFQPKLLTAISKLDDFYRGIKQEEKRLISRKASLNLDWFQRRMAHLANFREALREAMFVGRSIGDGFAWLFYERDRELVEKHLKHDYQPLLPPKIGRLGEKVVLDAFRYVDDHFQIYHGITTFLRMGDCSFVNLKTMRVAAIGEIKTVPLSESEYSMSLSLVAQTQEALPSFDSIISKKVHKGQKLNPKMEARLKRQVKQIGDAISKESQMSPKNVIDSVQNEFYFDAVEDAILKSSEDSITTRKASEGMVVLAIKISKNGKLSDTLLSKSDLKNSSQFDGIEEVANKIAVPNKSGNSLHLTSIGFGQENVINRPDRFPFVLWPINNQALEDVMFGRVMIITLFNPLPFCLALESRGFKVTKTHKSWPSSAHKTLGKRHIKLENLSYYMNLILHAGMTEGSVLSLIDQSMEAAEKEFKGGPLKMQINPRIYR